MLGICSTALLVKRNIIMNKQSDKFIPALYGGIIMALVSSIPFLNLVNCLCCAGILLGGFLAVFFYKNNSAPGAPPLNAGDCMVVGLMAGIVGAIAGTVLDSMFTAMFGNVMKDVIVKLLHDFNATLTDEQWRSIEESTRSKTGMFGFITDLFKNVILYAIFGLLGGLIGYSIYKPKQLVMMPPPPPVS
jgi:hypothetical protein